tara:strand:+ start:153 stop:1052 length:900 start_codon:yes stop_codon:yes gene_type:complete
MNVLSLFNGMSTGHTALDNVGIKVNKYYSSEIKPAAIKLTQHHYPDTIQLGDVTKWKEWDINWEEIDMVLSGSPCQDLSIAGKRAGLYGSRSSLFFTFVDILNHIKKLNHNVLFLQENVGSASREDVGIMSRELGVYPVRINSELVTAQMRDRYYWSNIRTKKDGLFGDIVTDIPKPKDRKIIFQEIITDGNVNREKCQCIGERYVGNRQKNENTKNAQKYLRKRIKSVGSCPVIYLDNGMLRTLNKIEICRLQGFPDDWCDILSYRDAGSLLGDGWTLPVIEHIFSFIKENNETKTKK